MSYKLKGVSMPCMGLAASARDIMGSLIMEDVLDGTIERWSKEKGLFFCLGFVTMATARQYPGDYIMVL